MHKIELGDPHLVHDVGPGPSGGGRFRSGRLLRGSYNAPFSAEDLARLRAHGLTAILDLRSEREAGKLPQSGQAEPGIQYRRISIGDEASRPLPGQCASLADLYLQRVANDGPALAEAVAFVVAPRQGSVLVHCRTGRDRTGLVVALALSLAGWDRRTVVAHQALAVEAVAPLVARRRASWLAKGKDLEFFDAMNTGSVPAMAQALAWVGDRHGTAARYLSHHGAPDTLAEQAVERLGSPAVV